MSRCSPCLRMQTEVLQRLRDSYSALSEGDVLTGADQAVLAVVKITLKHLSKAGYLRWHSPLIDPLQTGDLFRAAFGVGYDSAL